MAAYDVNSDLAYLRERVALAKSDMTEANRKVKIAKLQGQMTEEEANNVKKQAGIEDKKKQAALLTKKQNEMSSPARYFKPAFLLDTLTPFLTVSIMLYDSDNQPYYINVLSGEEPDVIHNNLKSFKYTVLSPAPHAEISLIDVDQEIIEMLMIRFAALGMNQQTTSSSTIDLLIEYGWTVSPELHAAYNDQVAFTEKIIMKFNKMDIKVNPEGTTEATFSGIIDMLPPPYHTLTPYKVITQNPAVVLVLLNLLQMIQNSWEINPDDIYDPWEESKTQVNLVQSTAKYLYFICHIRDIEQIRQVIEAITGYYFGEKPDVLQKLITKKTIESGLFGTVNDSGKWVKGKKGFISLYEATGKNKTQTVVEQYFKDLKPINMSDTLQNLLSAVPGSDGNTFPSPVQFLQNITKPNIPREGDNEAYLSELLRNADPIAAIKTALTKGRQFAKNRENPPRYSAQALDNMVQLLTTVAKNVYIHPIAVWYYTYVKFLDTIAEFNNAPPANMNPGFKLQQYFITLIDFQNVHPLKYATMDYDESSGRFTSIELDDTLLYSKIEQHKWCKPAQEFYCATNTTWIDYLKKLTDLLYVRYETDDAAQATSMAKTQKLNDDSQPVVESSPKATYKKNEAVTQGSTEKTYYVPMRLNTSGFLASPAQAARVGKILYKLTKLTSNNETPNPSQRNLQERLRKLSQTLDTNVRGKQNRVIMFISDIASTDGIFNVNTAATSIVQTYSIRGSARPGDTKDYNPGWPTVWDTNFPDVISFSPEMDFSTAMRTITDSIDTPLNNMQSSSPGGIVSDEFRTVRDKLLKELSTLDKMSPSKNKKLKAQRATIIQDVDKLMAKYETLSKASSGVKLSPYSNKETVTFPIDWEQRASYSGQTGEALIMKKKMQDFRRLLIMNALQGKATLKVIGDPSFMINDVGGGKWIFLKFIKPNGELGIYTGLYILQNVTHEISSGQFTTTLELLYNPQSGNQDAMKEISKLWSQNDKITLPS